MTEMQPARSCLAIVLAAGEGTRMKSRLPKVLHPVAGRSLLGHALSSVAQAGADAVAVVISSERPEVGEEALKLLPAARIATQHERRGTAHAVLAAREALKAGHDHILVAFADTPLVRPETFAALRDVQPADLRPSDITARLGAPWIPADDIVAFVKEKMDADIRILTQDLQPVEPSFTKTTGAQRDRIDEIVKSIKK